MTALTKLIAAIVLCSALLFDVAHARKRVLGVLFVEKGKVATQQQQDAVFTQLKLVQRAWLDNFGATFELDPFPVRVVQADHRGAWYVKTPSPNNPGNVNIPRWYRLQNIREEVVRKLSLDADVRIIVYPTSKRDGRVGAFVNLPVGAGAYMDFDDLTCVYGAGESTPFSDGIESVCGAHELHEFGHIFGLNHEGPFEDCMQQGFYKQSAPNGGLCQFSEQNRQKVRNTQGEWLTVTSLGGSGGICTFTDACNPSRTISANPGYSIEDSCGDSYLVSNTCGLSFVCAFTDACDPSRLLAGAPGELIQDACARTYRVLFPCGLTPA